MSRKPNIMNHIALSNTNTVYCTHGILASVPSKRRILTWALITPETPKFTRVVVNETKYMITIFFCKHPTK